MEIEKVQANKEKGTSNPAVAKLLAQARELIYEAIAIEAGDPVEEVKAFFVEIEKANKEANDKEQTHVRQIDRQHTLFTNLVGTDGLVGICIIVGYQKKDADVETVQPIKYLASRIIEPLGADVLASAAMGYTAKNQAVAPTDVEVKAEAPSIGIEIEEAVTVLEPQEGEGIAIAEAVENTEKEDIPF